MPGWDSGRSGTFNGRDDLEKFHLRAGENDDSKGQGRGGHPKACAGLNF